MSYELRSDRTGIYKISSKSHPDRVYIGSTKLTTKRWAGHRADLRHNRHHSSKLQNHVNKYGLDDLTFEMLEVCLERDLIVLEQKYLDLLHPYFNCCPVAGNCTGRKFTNKTIEKMRISGTNKNRKHIVCTFFHKELGYETCTIFDLYEKYHLNHRHKAELLTGKRQSEGGWSIVADNKIIEQYTYSGRFIREWPSILEAACIMNIKYNSILRCITGKYSTVSKCIWKYKGIT